MCAYVSCLSPGREGDGPDALQDTRPTEDQCKFSVCKLSGGIISVLARAKCRGCDLGMGEASRWVEVNVCGFEFRLVFCVSVGGLQHRSVFVENAVGVCLLMGSE